MTPLPITYCLFTSTRGHWGRKTDWKLTLNHWDRQLPLPSLFNLVAHVKISPDELELGAQMVSELEGRGFHVIQTVGSWTRGLSHGGAYLRDMVTVSKNSRVYQRPYFLLVEDDSIAVGHNISIEDLLLRSCQMLATNHELVTARLIRRCDYERGVPHLSFEADSFSSPNVDFQPLVIRSLDFYRLCMVLEANPHACDNVHCEQLWAIILRQFSRSEFKHLVYRPDLAETVHIGVQQEEHDQLVQQYNLSA